MYQPLLFCLLGFEINGLRLDIVVLSGASLSLIVAKRWGKALIATRPRARCLWPNFWVFVLLLVTKALGVLGRQNTSPFLLSKKSNCSGLSRTRLGAPLAGDNVGCINLDDILMAKTDLGDNSRLSRILWREFGSFSNTKSCPRSWDSKSSNALIFDIWVLCCPFHKLKLGLLQQFFSDCWLPVYFKFCSESLIRRVEIFKPSCFIKFGCFRKILTPYFAE